MKQLMDKVEKLPKIEGHAQLTKMLEECKNLSAQESFRR
jgi:hypothetical protein